jgi:putative hydrolase
MTPEAALDRVMHCIDRAHESSFRAKAFQRARDVVRTTDPAEIAERAAAGTLKQLDGIGDSSAKVIMEALAGEVPSYLAKLEATTQVPITPGGERYREALRGDCHLHSTWSDGGAEIEEMAATARSLGHEYMVLTDHSARLTIAHGLDRERLERQLADIEALNDAFDDFRILTGMEVDIFEDGTSTSSGTAPAG